MITLHLLNIFVMIICSPYAKSYPSHHAGIMTPANGQNGNTNQDLNNIASAMFPPGSNNNVTPPNQGVSSGSNPSYPMAGGAQSGQSPPTGVGGQTAPNPSYPMAGGPQMGQSPPTGAGQSAPNPSYPMAGGSQMGQSPPTGAGQSAPNPSYPMTGGAQTGQSPPTGAGQTVPNPSYPMTGGAQTGQLPPTGAGQTGPNPSYPTAGGAQTGQLPPTGAGQTGPNPSNPMAGGAQMGQSPPNGLGQTAPNPSNQMPGGAQIGPMPGGGQMGPSPPTGVGQTRPNPSGGSNPSGVPMGNIPSITPGMAPTNSPNSGGISNTVFPTNPSVMVPATGGGGNMAIQPLAQGIVYGNMPSPGQNGNFGSATQFPLSNLGQPPRQIQNKMLFETKCEEYYSMGSRKVRKAKVQAFIVGGTNSSPKEFPHMAALGYGKSAKKEWLCGGSLISENYVLTAAHCLTSKTLGAIQFVRLGATDLRTETLDSEDYNVIKRIAHPDYNPAEQYNDIALLQLETPVKFSDSIAPICLYPSTNNIDQQKLIATGWGKTEATGNVSPELQKVELEYFPNSECQKSYVMISKLELPRGIIDETQICAGSRKEEKDTCQGDSGGPLQIQDNGKFYLVGITSFGIGCGKPGSPGVYTRVSSYIHWIENIVWGNEK